jgi:hypothetical protein
MKQVFIIIFAALTISISAQWSPKNGNPYKWYHIQKDTSIMDIQITGFDVCIYQGCWQYNEFSIDSSGNVAPPIITANIWFREYSDGSMYKNKLSKYFNDFTVKFYNLPFGCEDNEMGISQIVNNYLSKKYNVPLNKITE